MLAAVIGLAPDARAQQQDALRTARAQKLFDDAKRLLDEGHVADACAAFAESRRLDAQLGTLLNLALCHEREGKIASAWAEYNGVVEGATRAAQPKRADFAKARARALEPRLARVTFVHDRTSLVNLRMTIDGQPVETSLLDGTPVPVDPGTHTAVVSAEGRQSAGITFVVPDGPSTTEVKIPVMTNALPPPQPAKDGPADRTPSRSPLATVGWAAVGVGTAGLVAGGAFGVLALSKRSDADAGCTTDRCLTQESYQANEDAARHATVSTVLVVAGAALLAGGIALVVLRPQARSNAPSATTADGLVVRF